MSSHLVALAAGAAYAAPGGWAAGATGYRRWASGDLDGTRDAAVGPSGRAASRLQAAASARADTGSAGEPGCREVSHSGTETRGGSEAGGEEVRVVVWKVVRVPGQEAGFRGRSRHP